MLGRNTPIMGAAASAAGGTAEPRVASDAAPASFKTSRLLADGSCDIATSLRDVARSSRTVAASRIAASGRCAQAMVARKQLVRWVERSQTHHQAMWAMGFAYAQPIPRTGL